MKKLRKFVFQFDLFPKYFENTNNEIKKNIAHNCVECIGYK